jgi:DNA-binding NarL/FixJ family response regulator
MVRSVVLAEDNLEHCFFFRKSLKEVAPQIQLTEVNDGEKLVRLLERYLPDLLFLDLSMPCKNGMQCIREIRENKSLDLMPIIVYSINSKNHSIQTAYDLGANLYIIKPQEYGDMVSCLEKVLSMDWKNPKSITGQYTSNKKQPFSYSTI